MTREIESQLKQMFTDLDEAFPTADFTARVMSRLLRARRRQRILGSSAVLAVLAFVGFSFPYLEGALGSVAAFPQALFDAVSEPATSLMNLPLVYVYGTALSGYLLFRLMQRLQVRIF